MRAPQKRLQPKLINTSSRLRKILIHIPKEFLEEFDKEILGLYASRNEAIRAGMILVLDTLKKRRTVKNQHESS